ncbi:hypothetical protein AGABI1DRAFT_111490 [Agaricus bisporus var. burnettii JB137-S8]|uniref:Non-ribosomal peptide synthetase n=2 Tax=Agaricus bisporus var. burnettii TaxID=192524 RepID=K5XHM8_AGABU|nr:hypothetical protein AGABI2DRAFT_190718 [Agaricus bisporus var. bisporus H97]XP_007326839.1 uncharacterized protein AGABI1DRAFT_111490 [Agaricus bisporus var. burnettii JB137-S8]EKM82963.1 hypothetical protein AGABI1DRAFT_111490 [Agaricus bisporus var. burnettii JB137-S8]EKV50394.1 hypothetical protein AGABI2DRAFT_190718 [Agaricus bisporus var. bisporus H97]KAF7777482.1 hypothetical protein Agabi119p4_3554 [Agaricus bisporus var. burnettii]
MSDNVQTVDISQAGDIEGGNHEPWTHQDAPQGSAPVPTSSQPPLDRSSPPSAAEPSKEAKEIVEAKGTTPEAQQTPPEAQQAAPEAPQTKPEGQPAKPEGQAVKKPKPPPHKYSKWVLFRLYFNTYRKFFVFVVAFNLTGLIISACEDFPYAHQYAGTIAVANLNFAVLMRNEIFGRALYLFFNTFFAKWPPLWFRLGITSSLQHLGGIHSGCGVSAVGWLTYRVYNIYNERHYFHPAVLATGLTSLFFLCLTALAAFPWVRNTHHNVFERGHRFIGWWTLFCTWGFVLVVDLWMRDERHWNYGADHVFKQQDFWYTFFMTTLIALPWFFVRRVPVEIQLPSTKVAIIKFQRGMQEGLLGRISRSPVWEYHLFGTISEGKKSGCHYMVAGVQGDFTKSLVNDPPTHLWTRELKIAAISNSSKLYKRGIRVCTGTGIGAGLSTCLQSPNWYLIWIGSDQLKTFGPTIAGLIRDGIEPERVTLYDTRVEGGRPDTMKLIKDAYYGFGAEVVLITSNLQGNTDMMRGCKEAGIPAFGTLWDF